MRVPIISAIAVGVLLSVRAQCVGAAVDHMPWARDLTDAQRLAAQRNQLVLIHFWSPDCAPCQAIQRDVFSSAPFGAWVASRYVPVKLNVKEFPSLAYQYGISRWPMDVITTPDGRVVHKMASPPDDQSYAAVLGQVAAGPPVHASQLAQTRLRESVLGSSGAQQGRPAPSTGLGYGQYVNPSRSSAQPGGGGNYSWHASESHRPADQFVESSSPHARPDDAPWDRSYSQQPQASQGESRHQPPTAGEIHNQYVSRNYRQPAPEVRRSDTRVAPREGPGVTDRSWDRSSHASQGIAPGAGLADNAPNDRPDYERSPSFENGNSDRNGGTSAIGPSERVSPYGLQQRGGSSPPAATLAGDSVGNQRDWQADKGTYAERPPAGQPFDPALSYGPPSHSGPSRQGSPRTPLPLGLEGYCPIALVDQSKWLKGDPRWGVVHRGRTYLFFSADAKERFWANPDRYSPALSGLDPVVLAERGDHMEGSRSHGLVFRDRVYLFSSEESLQQFVRSPQRYAEYVRQANAAADGQNDWR